MTVDQPLKPKVLSVLFLPNFTRSVEFPLETGGDVEEVTVTFADWVAEPPVPVQVSVNVVFAVRLPVLAEPEIAFVPDHPPDAVHEVALVELHVREEEFPAVIDVGMADSERETVGVGDAADPDECLYTQISPTFVESGYL
jgi:hypothetical protein